MIPESCCGKIIGTPGSISIQTTIDESFSLKCKCSIGLSLHFLNCHVFSQGHKIQIELTDLLQNNNPTTYAEHALLTFPMLVCGGFSCNFTVHFTSCEV